MQIICLSCGKQLSVNDQREGLQVRCNGCNALVDSISGLPATSAGDTTLGERDNATPPVDSKPGMLIACVCGAELEAPDAPGSTIRCRHCHRLLTIPSPQSSQPQVVPAPSAVPSTPPVFPTPAAVSPPSEHAYQAQPHRYSNPVPSGPSISDNAIIITAASCLGVLVLLGGAAALWMYLTEEPPTASVESVEAEKDRQLTTQRTVFQEGYSMILPSGFKQESREETDRGYTVYRFSGEDRCHLTFAIVPDKKIYRYTKVPDKPAEARVPGVPELNEGMDVDAGPTRTSLGGMGAGVFRYYEKETWRGVNFTYLMVVMDNGRKLIIKIAGKHGRYSEKDENIIMPSHWYQSLLTFRREHPN